MATNETAHRFVRAEAATAHAAAHAKPTILIAEDHADSCEMMRLLLEGMGYQTVCAADGPQALEAAMLNLPDLVLLDLEMPKVDGLTVTRKLRAHPGFKKVPIVILSGHDPETHREAAREAGCNDFLLKPIDFDRLGEILGELIPHHLAIAQVR